MERLTRRKNKYECRIKECFVEDWMYSLYGHYLDIDKSICDDCPIMSIANRLAELEDEKEQIEDDLK